MNAPRFYVITNDLPRAALEFHCHPRNLPHWMAVLDNLDDWMKIPSGAKCMGLWYGSAADLEGWRNAWSTRKERGDLIGITPEELDKIHAWAETARKAPDLKLLYGIEPDADGLDRGETEEATDDGSTASSGIGEGVPSAPAAIVVQQQTPVKRGQKWT